MIQNNHENIKIRDIDIVPTIASLMGMPIPAENYGILIPDFYKYSFFDNNEETFTNDEN